MNKVDLLARLSSSGIQFSEDHFKTGNKPDMPYITYKTLSRNCMYADGVVYYSCERIQLEMHVKNKDTAAEALLESILDGFSFRWEEASNKAEACYTYTIFMEV